MPYQYGNAANPRVHEETTGPEILADCPEIDVFVAGLGTGGTLMGVARFLRRPSRACGSSRPSRCPARTSRACARSTRGSCPRSSTRRLLDGKYLVSNRDAVAALRDLVREGIFAGPSSGRDPGRGARVAETMDRGTIVALLPDGGWKYLSAGTYSRDLDEMEDELEGGVNWW